jgi:2-polyprenyl-3-methyl-5-hydroxy-6-metoxy-1,4-benzoquinol methylase
MIHIHKNIYQYLEEINEGVLRNIPTTDSKVKSQSVLDVGCGSGALSLAIKQKGYEVWGIEENKEASSTAELRIDRVIRENLYNYEKISALIGERTFSYLIFSDVLEHTYDPFLILSQYLKFLEPNGKVIISVPNALTWTNRIAFLFGSFEYSDTGVMDRTHIRWFTFRTAKRLVKATGCKIIKIDFTPYVIRSALPLIKKIFNSKNQENRRQLIDSKAYKFYMKYIYFIEYNLTYIFKRLFGFRIIIIGQK